MLKLFALLPIALLIFAVAIGFRAFVISKLWNWFGSDMLDMPKMDSKLAVGISAGVEAFNSGNAFAGPAKALALGYVAKHFIK